MSRGLEWMDEGTCQTLRAANIRGLGGLKNDWCLRKGKRLALSAVEGASKTESNEKES